MNETKKWLARSVLTALAVSAAVCFVITLGDGPIVMCRASIGSNSVFARNLNIGVLVLLVPPVSIYCAIFVLLFVIADPADGQRT